MSSGKPAKKWNQNTLIDLFNAVQNREQTADQAISYAINELGLVAIGGVERKTYQVPNFSAYFSPSVDSYVYLGRPRERFLIGTRLPRFAIMSALLGDPNCPTEEVYGEHGVLNDEFGRTLRNMDIQRPHYGIDYSETSEDGAELFVNRKLASFTKMTGFLTGNVHLVLPMDFREIPELGPGMLALRHARSSMASIPVISGRDTPDMTPRDYKL